MNYLVIEIPQVNQIKNIEYNRQLTARQICQEIYQKLFPQNTISTVNTKLIFRNKELDIDKSILTQEIQKFEQLQFYYSQQLQINCICENQNFSLQVNYLDKIADYLNYFTPKFKKPYKDHQINILCKRGAHKLDTMWFQTGISNNSQVSIQILLPLSFTFKNFIFKEFLPSTWKIHKLIAYIRGKKQINDIIQFKSLNKTIDYDLELYQLYPNIYDLQIEIIEEPQYLIQLSDGRSKKIIINSNNKVSTLCEQIKKEFNINEDLVLDLQYGQMTLNHQALIVDEMILNNSTIVITNQNLNSKTNNISNIRIILVNKRNPSQIHITTLQPTQIINALDQSILLKDNFSIQYFYKGKQVSDKNIIQDLVQDKETEINLEFAISKKRSIMKNIETYDGNYVFRFKYLNKEYSQNVSITKPLKQIEEDLKRTLSIPEEYSIFQNDSLNQVKSIKDLELQSVNIFFEFKKIDSIPVEILIHPSKQTLKIQASTEETVMQLREKLQKIICLKENDQARIQIQLNQTILTDDQHIYKELKANKKNQIEVFILKQFQIQFQDENQQIITDDVYEDYCILDSVISLGLEACNFFINKTLIDVKKSFQSYNLNSKNQIIKYSKLLSGNFNFIVQPEPSINKPHEFNVNKLSQHQDQSKKQ